MCHHARLGVQPLAFELCPEGLAKAVGKQWTPALEAELCEQLIMTWDDIRILWRAGMGIESHTRSHRVLQTLNTEQLAIELAGARADIEREVGEAPRTIAYPVGYAIRDIPTVRDAITTAGYKLGFTAASGTNYLWREVDPLDIRRLSMQREISISMFRGQLAIPPLAFSRTALPEAKRS